MKHSISLALIMVMTAGSLLAQTKTRVSPHTTATGTDVSITYGQPSKKGKLVFGTKDQHPLVPYFDVWRAGDDDATEVTVTKNCLFAGRQLNAGTYTMYVIPESKEWTIILNSELKQWGADNYSKIQSKNVIKAAVAAKHIDKTVETFTITPQDGGFTMEWENTSVFVPVRPF